MAGVTCVTAMFFGIRSDRPDDYYLRPLRDFFARVTESDAKFVIATNKGNGPRFDSWRGIADVIERDLDTLVAEVWSDPNWIETYRRLLARNPTHRNSAQGINPRLIGTYLAKYPLLREQIDAGAEAALWFDAGHWISWGLNHDHGRYQSSIQDGVTGARLAERVLAASRRHGISGMLGFPGGGAHSFHMPIAWMKDYWDGGDGGIGPLFMGSFWLVHRDQIGILMRELKEKWALLLEDGKAGCDENALTLAAWRHNWHGAPYAQWVEFFKGSGLTAENNAEARPSLHSE